MINRQTNIADNINGQPLLENENPKPLATFTFAWTKNREQLFDIHRETYLENTYPLYMQYSKAYTKLTNVPLQKNACSYDHLKEILYDYQVNELYLTMVSPTEIDMFVSYLTCKRLCPRLLATALCKFAQK